MILTELLELAQTETLTLFELSIGVLICVLCAVALFTARRRAVEDGTERRAWFPLAALFKSWGDRRWGGRSGHQTQYAHARQTGDTLVRRYKERRSRYVEPAVDFDWPTSPGWPSSAAPIGFEFWEAAQRPVRTLTLVGDGVYRA